MRRISFQEYDQKRKEAKLSLLNIKDDLDNKPNEGLRERNKDKVLLLFKLAKSRQKRLFKKVGKRKYRVIS